MGVDDRGLLERVRQRYATCASYADTGRQTTTHDSESLPSHIPPGMLDTGIQFRTLFRRSGEFLLSFQIAGPRCRGRVDECTVLRVDGVTRTRWSRKERVEELEFRRAIAGATGISRGLAVMAPGLLVPEEIELAPGARLLETEATDCGEESGFRWFDFERTAFGPSSRIWIDESTQTVRRVQHEFRSTAEEQRRSREEAYATLGPEIAEALRRVEDFRDSHWWTVTDYEPVFDVEIEDTDFVLERD